MKKKQFREDAMPLSWNDSDRSAYIRVRYEDGDELKVLRTDFQFAFGIIMYITKAECRKRYAE